MGVTFVNKNLEYTDTFNYLGVSISAKGIDFKLMCQSRVSAEIKMSTYFKNMGCNGGGYPPHYSMEDTPFICTSIDGVWTWTTVSTQKGKERSR